MLTFGRKPFPFSADQLPALLKVVERDLPAFAPRLVGMRFSCEEILQTFWDKIRILDIMSVMPTPARLNVAWLPDLGRWYVLTAHLDNLNAMVAFFPCSLVDPSVATAYGIYGTAWTTTAELGELRVASADEIPWFRTLDAAQSAIVEAARALPIGPERLDLTLDGYELHYWLVASQRLVERTLVIGRSGHLDRRDEVRLAGLPVAPGKRWGMVNGRFVPVG